jgi:hypothetical protein
MGNFVTGQRGYSLISDSETEQGQRQQLPTTSRYYESSSSSSRCGTRTALAVGAFILVSTAAASMHARSSPAHVDDAADSSVLFYDDFDTLSASRWSITKSMADDGNGEFQVYTDDPSVLYTRRGKLVIDPRIMDDSAWEHLTGYPSEQPTSFKNPNITLQGLTLIDGTTLDIADCTSGNPTACSRAGQWDNPLPPMVSGKITSKFAFTRGTLETRIRPPIGDWIWSALWLLPVSADLPWPVSGEIDLMEAKGNSPSYKVVRDDREDSFLAGNNVTAATFHCANWGGERVLASSPQLVIPDFEDEEGFIVLGLDKRDDYMAAYARKPNGEKVILIEWPDQKLLNCSNTAYDAPGDPFLSSPFYIIVNVAVGGADGGGVPYWGNGAMWRGCVHPTGCDPKTYFLKKRDEWMKTWTRPLEVDWVKVTE